MRPLIDLTGKRFGRLTVVSRAENEFTSGGNQKIMWNCICDCGNKCIVDGFRLRSEHTRSCGCLHQETLKELHKKFKKYNTYNLSGEYGIGYTSKGNEFYFDLEDYEKIKLHCWTMDKLGYLAVRISSSNTVLLMHRIITDCPPNKVVDHINHNTSDNRKSNLRICTHQENKMNIKIPKNNTSGTTGVCWQENMQQWSAEIMCKGIRHKLGFFNNINDAIKVRKEAEETYFGKYKIDDSVSNYLKEEVKQYEQ